MTTPQPFSLRIFVADGDPAGLRLVERSNWIGKALVFPRKLYPEVRSRSEFQQTDDLASTQCYGWTRHRTIWQRLPAPSST